VSVDMNVSGVTVIFQTTETTTSFW